MSSKPSGKQDTEFFLAKQEDLSFRIGFEKGNGKFLQVVPWLVYFTNYVALFHESCPSDSLIHPDGPTERRARGPLNYALISSTQQFASQPVRG